MKIEELFAVDGKVALVTGGSRGIGRMIAHGLVANGVRTYITARKAEACDATAEELSAFGECISLPADVSDGAGARALAAQIAEREPELHILVNNAGASWGAPLEEFPESGLDKVYDINLKAPFLLTQALLPQLRAAASAEDPARIIMIGSVDGIAVPVTDTFSYAASKAGVHMLGRQLAHHLHRDQITVNSIAPGPFDSKMMAYTLDPPESREIVRNAVPLKRIGEPTDMAGTVLFLCSKAGSYLTGAVIPVDGGLSTHG